MTWNNTHMPKKSRREAATLPEEKTTTTDQTRKMSANQACRSQKVFDA